MIKIFALADAMEKNLDMKAEMGKLLDSKAAECIGKCCGGVLSDSE